jgi:hypothetical protein
MITLHSFEHEEIGIPQRNTKTQQLLSSQPSYYKPNLATRAPLARRIEIGAIVTAAVHGPGSHARIPEPLAADFSHAAG